MRSRDKIQTVIETDCAAVINRISSFSPVTPFSTFLYQIVREIRAIARKWSIEISLAKIKAYLDDLLD